MLNRGVDSADVAPDPLGEPACHRPHGTVPAHVDLAAAADGRLHVQLSDFGVGAFYGTGLDHRQQLLCLPVLTSPASRDRTHGGVRSRLSPHAR
jgi:hypothetical protein